MTTIAELGLAVNSESAVQAADNLDGMVEAGARAEQAINKVAETSEQAKSRLLALGKAALESSTYQETLNRAYEATAGASAAAAREQLNQSAALRQSAKAASESSAAQEKVVASEKKATAAIAEQRTQLEKLLGQIDPTTAALARLGDQQRQLERFKASGVLDPATFSDYKAKIQQTEASLASFDKSITRTGNSAKQNAAALRMLPAQFSDIFVSLQGGQAPLTVFLQQGSQIKDSFGGIGAAAKAMGGYIVGLVNPFTLAAAAAAGLGVAYYKGSEESTRFKTALILTGSAAGASADSLASMASKVGETVGTTGKAADALNQLASGSKIAGESFEAVAIAALSMEKATGRAVADTVAEFVKIGKDPVAAAKELNDQYGFLTASVYSQIVSLKEQGREQEAVKLLTDTYADTVQSRSNQVIENLSLWERAWNGVAGAAAQALDGLKNVGRESSYEDQIKALRAKLTGSEAFDVGGVRMNPGAVSKKDRDDIQAQINFIELQRDADRARAQYLADQSRFQKDAISGIDLINREAGAASTNVDKLNDRLAELGKARTKNLENNSWSTEEQAKYEKAAAALRKQIADAQKKATKVESSPVDLTSFNDADNKLKALTASYQNSLRILDASQKAGLISSQQYAEQKSALIGKEKTEVEAAYNGQITALEAVRDKSTTTGAQRIQIDQKIADARSKMVDALKKLDADQEVLSVEMRGRIEKDEAAIKAFAQTVQDSLNLAQQGLDNQLAGFGLSDRDRARLQEDLKIRQDYQKQMERLTRDYGNIVNPTSGDKDKYSRETQILEDALNERLSKQEKFYRDEEQLRGDWSNGVSRAWRNYVDEASDAAGMTQSAFSDAFTGIEDVFVDFITTGKASFKDFANSVLADLARIVVKQQVIAPLLNAVFGGGGGGNGATSFGSAVGSLIGGGNASDSNGWGGMVSLGKNLYSAWSNLTGVGSSIASGYASGGISGAISGGAGYYGNMLSNIATTLGSGFTSLIGGNIAITGATAAGTAATTAALTGVSAAQAAAAAATVGAQGITTATLSAAVAEGAASVGTNIGIAGATTAAASSGIGTAISSAISSAAAMWPLAIVMGMYQSGKLYSAGVRPDGGEIRQSAGGTALGKAVMAPGAAMADVWKVTDNALSKVVGGKWAAILSGSTFSQAVQKMLGEKLFGTGYQTKDQGIQLGVTGGDIQGYQYEDQKKKGGLISGKSKKRTILSPLDAATQKTVQDAFDTRLDDVFGIFDTLNVDVPESALDGLNMATWKISLKDNTTDQVNQLVSDFFEVLGNEAVGAISKSMKLGLDTYNVDQLTEFASNLYSINDTFKLLNVNALPVSVWGGKLAEQYVALAGGMEAFNTATQAYYTSPFFTDAERNANTLAAVKKQFADLNVTFPGTREGFRAVVEGLDSTTDAGRSMFLTLMGLSSSASTAYDILKQQLTGAATGAQSALQRAISAQQKAAAEAYNATNTSLNDMVSTVTENVSGLNSVSTSLSSALKALRGDSDDAVKMLRAQAQATLQSALATARSGKSLSGFTGLEDALDTVSNNNTDLYGSMEDFARDQGRTANVVAELNAINGKQLTSAEASLAGLKTQIDLAKAAYDAQMAQYDQALEFAQAQMDALNGVDTSVMGVTAAVNAMNAAVVAAIAAINGKSTPTNAGVLIDTIYKDVLGRDADAGGKQYWQDQLASGALNNGNIVGAITNAAAIEAAYKAAGVAMNDGASYWAGQLSSGALTAAQLQEAVRNAAIANGSISGYATGGLISGPGTGTSDSIFARLSNGEYVMSADSVRMFGTGLLDQMNAGQLPAFAMGGGVGETGPQLNVTGPSRIFTANQTASMLRGGGDNAALLSELKQMREENKSQRFQIAKTNQQVASLLQKWDTEGAPKERDYAL